MASPASEPAERSSAVRTESRGVHRNDDRPGSIFDRRPAEVSDESVEAMGKIGEAVERRERARGHLYSFHQMCGTVDSCSVRRPIFWNAPATKNSRRRSKNTSWVAT